jgi:RNA polymerase sigma factor (sigma-70 family)
MDPQADFDALYRAHCGAVRAFVHRRVVVDDADDVVAEVFVAAWRRLDEAPKDPLLWLFGIARGLIANRRRAGRRRDALRERLQSTTVLRVDPGPQSAVPEIDGLLRAFASLHERDKEVLRLVAWDGLDRPAAAEVLGVAPAVFSLRLHRARRRLARAMDAGELKEARGSEPSSMEGVR